MIKFSKILVKKGDTDDEKKMNIEIVYTSNILENSIKEIADKIADRMADDMKEYLIKDDVQMEKLINEIRKKLVTKIFSSEN